MQTAHPIRPVEKYGETTPLRKVANMRDTWADSFASRGISTLGAAQRLLAQNAVYRIGEDVQIDMSLEFGISAAESDLLEEVVMYNSDNFMVDELRDLGFSPRNEVVEVETETAQVASTRGKARSYVHGLLGI